MREVGLLEVSAEVRTAVGRPQNLYALSDERARRSAWSPRPSPCWPACSCAWPRPPAPPPRTRPRSGGSRAERDALPYANAASCLEALVDQLDRVGFDPAVDGTDDDETAVIAFAHCPFRELAEAHPDLVCSLHRGMVEGFVDAMGDAEVEEFHPLVHRQPCQVTIASR